MIKSNFEALRKAKGMRENRNLSLRQISKETGLSLGTLLRIKSEYPDRIECLTLDHLCAYFQCPVGGPNGILERTTYSQRTTEIERIISYEGHLTMATEAEIRTYFAEDAIISLKNESKVWQGIEEVIQYYESLRSSNLKLMQYEHDIFGMEILGGVAIAYSQTLYRNRQKLDVPFERFFWQVWKLRENLESLDNTTWCIAEFHGGFTRNEAKEEFAALCARSENLTPL